MPKAFKLSGKEIIRFVPDIGYGIVTDEVTVRGNKIGSMYRSAPTNDQDSGWNFYSGTETQQYLDNPDNSSVLDLNTIVNYDPDIISFLTYPEGTRIERNQSGILEVVDKNIPKPEVIYLPPVEPGPVQITSNWKIVSRLQKLPASFREIQ